MANTVARILAWLAFLSYECGSSKMSTGDNILFQKMVGRQVLEEVGTDSQSMLRSRNSSSGLSLVPKAETANDATIQTSNDFTSAKNRYPYNLMTCESGSAQLRTKKMSDLTYDTISLAVESLYDSLSIDCDEVSCEQADFAGCVLRMAGHDFMDYDPVNKRGGSDGCVDFQDPDNVGLECLAEGEHGVSLLMAYQGFCTEVSLADFLVISAEALMSLSRTKHGLDAIDFKGQFRFGRKTARSCRNNVALPNPEDSCPATEKTFVDQMGLDWKGAAALMGVHTLGRAQSQNSGYEGHWSDPHNSRIFNNNYYVSIVSKGWMPKKSNWVNVRPGLRNAATTKFGNRGFPDSTKVTRIQWARSDGSTKQNHRQPVFLDGPEMMLNTDICLMFYNGHREPTKASTDECCTWVPHSRYAGMRNEAWGLEGSGVKGWLKDIAAKNGWCGVPGPLTEVSNLVHFRCCAGVTFQNCGNCRKRASETNSTWVVDNGTCEELPVAMNGPAEKDVIMFAHNETYWLQEFLLAWQKATENGAMNLKKLELTPSPSPTPVPTPNPTAAPTTPQPTPNPNCSNWCKRMSTDWTLKCTWSDCSGCGMCSAATPSPTPSPTPAPTAYPTQAPTLDPNCPKICTRLSQEWAVKCTWPSCQSKCEICSAWTSPTSSPTPAPPTPQPTPAHCPNWCKKMKTDWTLKCTWSDCSVCEMCSAATPSPTPSPTPAPTAYPTQAPTLDPNCPNWCNRLTSDWTLKCTWSDCQSCETCSAWTPSSTPSPTRAPPTIDAISSAAHCPNWCNKLTSDWTLKCTWPDCSVCGPCLE